MTETYTASLAAETINESSLYNKDLAPVAPARRTWRTYNYAALWISMSVNIPTYMLASGMIAGGMNWKQALFTVFLGNVLVLVPMLLNAHAGAQYGIPFPVFARASFGVLGANVPAILRALVACGWFGAASRPFAFFKASPRHSCCSLASRCCFGPAPGPVVSAPCSLRPRSSRISPIFFASSYRH
jgi:purine-cytosine permease-like protein